MISHEEMMRCLGLTTVSSKLTSNDENLNTFNLNLANPQLSFSNGQKIGTYSLNQTMNQTKRVSHKHSKSHVYKDLVSL